MSTHRGVGEPSVDVEVAPVELRLPQRAEVAVALDERDLDRGSVAAERLIVKTEHPVSRKCDDGSRGERQPRDGSTTADASRTYGAPHVGERRVHGHHDEADPVHA